MRVSLNGNIYQLKAGTGVQRSPLIDWPSNIRLDGQQKRKDRMLLSSWAIDRWSQGLGLEKMNVDVSSQQYRLWDVENCDTRYPSQIILSPAFNTCTIVPSRGDLDLHLLHGDQLYFVETARQETAADPNNQQTVAYQFSAPDTLGSNAKLLGDSVGSRIGSISAIRSFGRNIGFTAHDTSTTVFGRALAGFGTTPTYSSIVPTSGEVRPEIGDWGGTVHTIAYQPGEESVYFHTFGQDLITIDRVGSFGTVIGSYLASLETDGLTMFAYLPQGIYNFDATPAIIADTGRSKDKNCRQVMFGQDLYFKNKNALLHYPQAGDKINTVGYDEEDGLPPDKWGEITAMHTSSKFIFAAVQGATFSHILTMDKNNAWQYYARIPTAGIWVRKMFLSDAPDAIDRLWCIFGNHPFPGYFLNPMVNPLQAGTYSYVATGHFEPPSHDGGMPEEAGGYFDIGLTADGMGGSNIITELYGLDGAGAVTTLGVVATNSFAHIFGSPYGIEGHRIKTRFILAGANSGTTPIYRSAVLHYLKQPSIRDSFQFNIDLEQTVARAERSVEAVIGSLNYERGLRTLMPFQYGQIATLNVKVLSPMPSEEDVIEDRIYEGERTGFINLRVAEIR